MSTHWISTKLKSPKGIALAATLAISCLAGYLVYHRKASLDSSPENLKKIYLTWKTLGELDVKTGKVPSSVQKLLEQDFVIAGYMIANESENQDLNEFLLSPMAGGCIHVPPPPPNYIIHVKLEPGHKINLDYGALLVEGRLQTVSTHDSKNKFSYELVAKKVQPFPVR